MEIRAFQKVIRDAYFHKDHARGLDGTFMYFIEEVGELATALREGTREEQAGELADVLAWLLSVANLAEVDLQDALKKFQEPPPPLPDEKP